VTYTVGEAEGQLIITATLETTVAVHTANLEVTETAWTALPRKGLCM